MNEILIKDILKDINESLEQIKTYTLLSAKNVLTLDDVALLTGLSKSYLYKLTCQHEIPYYRPGGKMIYFDRAEIEAWQKRNRYATKREAEQEALAYVVAKDETRKGGVK